MGTLRLTVWWGTLNAEFYRGSDCKAPKRNQKINMKTLAKKQPVRASSTANTRRNPKLVAPATVKSAAAEGRRSIMKVGATQVSTSHVLSQIMIILNVFLLKKGTLLSKEISISVIMMINRL